MTTASRQVAYLRCRAAVGQEDPVQRRLELTRRLLVGRQLDAVHVVVGQRQAQPDPERLGQALGVGPGQRAGLLLRRATYLSTSERHPEAVACFREAAELAEQEGDSTHLGVVLFNLADTLGATDPAPEPALEPAGSGASNAVRRRRREPPPKPVAITVTRISSPIASSITAPKMTFAF